MGDVRDYRAMFGGDHLGAWDLPPNGTTVIISEVKPGEVRSGGGEGTKRKVDKRPIVSLKGKVKTFVLNKTNAKTIAQLYGKDPDGWIGQAISIYPTTTKFGNETVDCIRVRPTIPQRRPAAETSATPDEGSRS